MIYLMTPSRLTMPGVKSQFLIRFIIENGIIKSNYIALIGQPFLSVDHQKATLKILKIS
jgi:hypothetical protein